MQIYQVKYNVQYYCYYKADKKELFSDTTDIYKTYTDCADEINKIEGYELMKITQSLLSYFKNLNHEF
jgi:hypothetical protein